MPYRKIPIVQGEIYHVFNRSNGRMPIFTNKFDYSRVIELIRYYRFGNLPLKYSHYKRLNKEAKSHYVAAILSKKMPVIEILSYAIMPNHFHFLLIPKIKDGVSLFLRNYQHSYSKYFNTKYQRHGSLFQSMFKAVRIESDEQLAHVSRYIHLNPVTSCIITMDELYDYPWTSFNEYANTTEKGSFVSTHQILDMFRNAEEYKQFVADQVDYQRQLDSIKHLTE